MAIESRIKAIHRYKPPIQPEGGAGSIKILDLLEEMIDEALIIQEAYRIELDREPDFEKKLQAFIRNQSVIRLRKEEVLDKIDISEEDLLDYFRTHYEGDGRALEGKFEKRKKQIRKKLRKEREKALSENFVAMLKKQADIWIDRELLDSLDAEKDYAGRGSVLARVNGQPIPLDDMVNDMKRAFRQRAWMYSRLETRSEREKMREELRQQTLDGLITYELVEQEALRRDYTKDLVFRGIIARRKQGLLINEFRERIVYPLAIPTKKELTKYYQEHIDDFRKGYEVWFSEMILPTREDAEKTLKELKAGANFEYLAARVSEKWTPRGRHIWVTTDRFPAAIRNEVDRLEVGQLTNVLADGRRYRIIKLKGKRGGKPEAFSRVAGRLEKIVGQQKFNIVLSDYLAKLREESNIKINEKALKRIEEKYRAKPTEEAETTKPER
jgi:foldase protein PrsA